MKQGSREGGLNQFTVHVIRAVVEETTRMDKKITTGGKNSEEYCYFTTIFLSLTRKKKLLCTAEAVQFFNIMLPT